MAQDDLGLYPHGTPSGFAIPFDVIRPLGIIRQDFTDSVSGAISIPAEAEILALFASNDCIVCFDGVAALPANGAYLTKAMVIPAYTYVNIDHNAAVNFTVVGIREPGGVLFVTTVKKWQDTKKLAQYIRG